MSGHWDLRVDQGATFRAEMTFSYDTGEVDEDDQPVYAPYDFTGATITMEIRERTGAPVLVGLSSEDGGLVLDDPGEIELTLTPEQTAAVRGRARYDLLASFPSGDVKRLLEGNVYAAERITEGA